MKQQERVAPYSWIIGSNPGLGLALMYSPLLGLVRISLNTPKSGSHYLFSITIGWLVRT